MSIWHWLVLLLIAVITIAVVSVARTRQTRVARTSGIAIKTENDSETHRPSADSLAEPPGSEADLPKKSANFVIRHWRGELSLPVSYWVNGFLVGLLVAIAAVTARAYLEQSDADYGIAAAFALLWATVLVLTAWQVVGVWRSASNYTAAVEKRRFSWGSVAQFVVALGVIRTLTDFGSVGIPEIREGLQQGAWLAQYGHWKFRPLREGTELEVTGGIGHGIAADFDRTLGAMSNARLIHVNLYSGGLVNEAKQRALTIKTRSLATYTSTSCSSACSIVFLSGSARYLREGAKLGFHAYKAPGESASDARDMAQDQVADLQTAGVARPFAEKAAAVPPKEMWFPTNQELLDARVITAVTSGDEFSLSGNGEKITKIDLEHEVTKLRLYRALRKVDPITYDKVLDIMQAAVSEGRSLDDVRTSTLPMILALRDKFLPYSSSATILRTGKLFRDEMEALQVAPGRVCNGYAKGGDLNLNNLAIRYLPNNLRSEELEVTADILETGDLSRTLPSTVEVEAAMSRFRTAFKTKASADFDLLSSLDDPNFNPAVACRLYQEIFVVAVSLPEHDAELVVRNLLSPNPTSQSPSATNKPAEPLSRGQVSTAGK